MTPLTQPSDPNEEFASPGPEDVTEQDVPERRLLMPASRAHVLALLASFQSSITSGEPPLEELLAKSASLTVPGSDGRRTAPSRAAVASALDANFVDADLNYDPLDVSTRPGQRAEIASVPLEGTKGSSARRIVLSLKVGYDDGELRIRDITLSRDPKSERVP